MLAPALRLGKARAALERAGLQFVRGLFHVGGMMLWFAALPFVTLPELTAIGFTGPIFICLGATLFLGERMSGARWAAVLIGFSGVLLVVQPWAAGGFSGISRGVLLMLASAPVFAGSFLVAKTLTRHDPSEVVVLWQHLWVSVLLAAFALSSVDDAIAGAMGLARSVRIPRRRRPLLHDARVPRRRHLGYSADQVSSSWSGRRCSGSSCSTRCRPAQRFSEAWSFCASTLLLARHESRAAPRSV
jgi:hypothetical protein